MDAQAAAETQYDESQPDLTQNRKESKIMTRKRRILFMVLALVFMISLATPALAVTYNGSWGGCDYWMTMTRSASSATATFTYGATVRVYVYATRTVHLLASGELITPPQTHTYADRTTSITLGNSVYSDVYETYMTGEITSMTAKGRVGDTYIGSWTY